MKFKTQGRSEFKLIFMSLVAWTTLITLNSCAMFQSEPPHRVQMPLEIPEPAEFASLNNQKPVPIKKAPKILFSEPSNNSETTNTPTPTVEEKSNDIVASLIPPSAKMVVPDPGMYPGTPELPVFSTIAPDLFFDDMDRESLKKAISNQLDAMAHKPRHHRVRLGNIRVTTQELVDTLEEFLQLLNQNLDLQEFSQQIRQKFAIYTTGRGKNKRTLFTGYYTPLIEASRVKTDEYKYPLYDMPHDLNDIRPTYQRISNRGYGFHTPPSRMPTRRDIDGQNLLGNRNLEIAWLKDDLERFFLHIQGSGILQYPDGTREGVQYVGSNRYPYKSIGKQMIRDGAIVRAQGSMQGIKKYFKDNPQNIKKYLYQNKRYIFFRITERLPTGSGGAELVAGRAIATDKSLYPAGGLAFIMAKKPILDSDNNIVRWKNFVRFVLDQDTGSAIKGRGRADLYFGTGEEAGVAAGHYMQRGKLFYLVKK
jgi:membrane-bound lytic murein transglycosylase A